MLKHSINKGQIKPFSCGYKCKKKAIQDYHIDELWHFGVVEKATGPWESPVVVVPKPEPGAWRLCIDYRRLNQATIPEVPDIPAIHDILAHLGKAKIFSTFDLTKGFYQVELDEADRKLRSDQTSTVNSNSNTCRSNFGTLQLHFRN